MISYLKGTLVLKNEAAVVIEVGGIGFSVFMPAGDIARVGQIGESVTVNTFFQVKEEQAQLYGFLTSEELSYFNKLISISGVGPKAALAVLSVLSPSDLAFAIISEDVKAITRAQGVGTKVAQRIILELKSKIDTREAIGTGTSQAASEKEFSVGADTGAVNALIALGASPSEAQKTVLSIDKEGKTTEDIIKEALRRMSNGI